MVGNVQVGGNAPISVQSMTCTKTEDIPSTVAQINALEADGCEIVRVAIPGEEAVNAIPNIKAQIQIPLIADIHFDYRLAIESIKKGADKIRINPGNIGSDQRVKEILNVAKDHQIPIRIGVNSGSLEKDLLKKYGQVCAEALVESALRHIEICETSDYKDLVLSVKASHVPLMIETNRLLSQKIDYPLHLGVTEAGTSRQGILRSALGIGTLLAEGIGDTIRVSLTGDPVQEVKAAYDILRALELRKQGVTLISCPTCGRTEVNVAEIAEAVEDALAHIQKSLTVAVMGCAVNGPGEAKAADIGVACGKASALFFKNGEVVEKIDEKEIVSRLVKEVENWGE